MSPSSATPRRVILLAAAGLLAGAPSAVAGPLYSYGPSAAPVAGHQATLGPSASGGLLLQLPALSPATAGYKLQAPFGCTRAGTEIAEVRFALLRTQAASSLEARVLVSGGRHWGLADASMPQSPAGGQGYAVALPPGTCSAHLELVQVEQRAQHARGYFVEGLQMVERDVAPPALGVRAITGGWVRGNEASVAWGVADNYGSAGVGEQRISVAGQRLWAGRPGVGEHGVALPLASVGDGVHPVAVEVDGDGTAGAAAAGTLHVDRTAPTGTVRIERTGAYALRLAVGAADATSGVREWQLRARSATGPVISSSAAPAESADLREIAPEGGPTRTYLHVLDNAGNASGWIESNAVDLSPRGPAAVRPPAISGRARVGATLSAHAGEWAGAARIERAWERCNASAEACAPVAGESGSTYAVSGADEGKTIRLAETAVGAEASSLAHSPASPLIQAAGEPGGAIPPPGPAAGSAEPALADLRARPLRLAGLVHRGGRIPLWRGAYGARLRLPGRLVHADGRPAAAARIRLLDPSGEERATAQTGPRGRYVLRARATRGGVWSVAVTGAPHLRPRLRLRVRGVVRVAHRVHAVSASGLLVVRGAVIPRAHSGRKIVQLEYRDAGAWRVVAQASTDRRAAFRLRYRFRFAGRYDVPMRVVAPAERGWAFAAARSQTLRVLVRR